MYSRTDPSVKVIRCREEFADSTDSIVSTKSFTGTVVDVVEVVEVVDVVEVVETAGVVEADGEVEVFVAIRTHFFFLDTFRQTSVTRLPDTTVVIFEPTRVHFCPTVTA